MNPDLTEPHRPLPDARTVLLQKPTQEGLYADLDRARWIAGHLGRGSVHANGFRLAACLLYDGLNTPTSGRKLEADKVFFSYAYTWRHHLELQMKYLQDRLHHLWPDEEPASAGHKLTPLWESLRDALTRRLAPTFPDEHSRHFTRLLHQLHQLDPDGQTLRYERDTKQTINLINHDRIDIETFHKGMLAMSDYLEAIDMALDAVHEHATDMRENFPGTQ